MDRPVRIEVKPIQNGISSLSISAAEERAAESRAKCRRRIDIAVLCIVLVILWGLLSLPAVFNIIDLSEVRAQYSDSFSDHNNYSNQGLAGLNYAARLHVQLPKLVVPLIPILLGL